MTPENALHTYPSLSKSQVYLRTPTFPCFPVTYLTLIGVTYIPQIKVATEEAVRNEQKADFTRKRASNANRSILLKKRK